MKAEVQTWVSHRTAVFWGKWDRETHSVWVLGPSPTETNNLQRADHNTPAAEGLQYKKTSKPRSNGSLVVALRWYAH